MTGLNFTERVRKVLALAKDEANRLRHEYVGTEHILLGLLGEGEGVGAAVLRNLGADFGKIQRMIEDTVVMGKADGRNASDLPYTTRAKTVLELTLAEARDLAHNYVGTEHLLLGLLREKTGIAAQILNHAGVTEGATRAELRRIVDSGDGVTRRIPTGIMAVTVEVRLADGSVAREEFRSVEEAIDFLNKQ